MKNMFLVKFGDFKNFRFFDIDTPIDEKSKKSQKNFFSKTRGNIFFVGFMHKKHDLNRF